MFKLNSSQVRRTVAVGSAFALVAAIPILDSQASTRPPAAAGADSSEDGLNVVVGETVAVTTDQSGNTTPLDLYILNGQVSGSGSGQIDMPSGSNGEVTTRSVTSGPGEVSNFTSFGGSFSGDLPVTSVTAVTVNGETIDPNKAYDLTGDIEVTYTVTNHTSRDQEISFRNISGVTETAVVNVPVPFGDSFATTFGEGWDIVDSGGMAVKTEPAGAKLSNTFVLFPMIQGVVGGTTQSVTVKARAENADLPAGTHTIVPVPLDVYEGGVGLELAPAIESKILSPLDSTLQGAIGQIMGIANLISGYTGSFQKLDSQYIDPLVYDVNQVNVNPVAMTESLAVLSRNLTDLGRVLDANAVAKADIALLFAGLSNFVGSDVDNALLWLGQLIETAGPEAASAARSLKNLQSIFKDLDPVTLVAANAQVKTMCVTVGPTSNYYGYQFLGSGAPGAVAVQNAISAGSPLFGPKKPWVSGMKALQTQLNSQSSASLLPYLQWAAAGKLSPELASVLQGPVCKPVTTIVGPVAAVAAVATPLLGKAATALDKLALIAADPQVKKVYQEVIAGVQVLDKVLSNPSCTNSEIIDPIVNAIKKYGVDNVSAHAAEILESMLTNCGLEQIMAYFGNFDQAIGEILKDLGTVVGNARSDVPKIAAGLTQVKSLANIGGKAFDAIPGLGADIGLKISGLADGVDTKGTAALNQVSNFVAQTQATLEAMNNRGIAGDGSPYGNATLAQGTDGKVTNLTVYQITVQPAQPYGATWTTSIIAALVFLLLAVGVGTFLFRRRIKP